MHKALFLDRDGTLILDKGYLSDPAGVELIPGVVEGLRRARTLGYLLFLHTNQSGIGRGYYALEDAVRCNERMEQLIALPPAPLFADICIAPETGEQPVVYRKPSPRFLLESIRRHALDPAQCWMVGDRESDIRAGLGAGIRAAALCTGELTRGDWERLGLPGVPVYSDFGDFAAGLD
ncbi:MAG: HAD-IIIA family hydrolase [Opitutaceae bacterium]|jgi:D-glycero-D-manno-heptose 1,7-bisphosphate phosphatase|nr:HAD-IIIA family hydrolase [Opitutaceae bacterium]